jgi:hypothetical protein
MIHLSSSASWLTLSADSKVASSGGSLIRFCVCLHWSFPRLQLWRWSEPKCVKAVIRSQIVVLLCCARVCFCFAVCAQMFLFFFPQTHSARVSSKAKTANNSGRDREKTKIKGLLLSLVRCFPCVWALGDFWQAKSGGGGVTSRSRFVYSGSRENVN